MSIRLEFDIEFKSDYHVGAGHGLGLQVDFALLRDADNVPVIRGMVLTGLLRESLMNLLNLTPLAVYRQCEASSLKTVTLGTPIAASLRQEKPIVQPVPSLVHRAT